MTQQRNRPLLFARIVLGSGCSFARRIALGAGRVLIGAGRVPGSSSSRRNSSRAAQKPARARQFYDHPRGNAFRAAASRAHLHDALLVGLMPLVVAGLRWELVVAGLRWEVSGPGDLAISCAMLCRVERKDDRADDREAAGRFWK